jgi:4-amino-4-deoxy-L-arabinose transferase-like glycosyltransferase
MQSGVLLILFLLGYRLLLLAMYPLNLQFDEAQYWLWSQSLAWGYFSKPPMIAWFLSGYQWLFGEQAWILKSMSTWLYVVTTLGVYGIANTLFCREVALYSALLFLTMPGVSLGSMIVSTDACLILFWALTVWMVSKASFEKWSVGWLLGGFFAGLGLLSKYTMLLLLPSCILYVLTVPNKKIPWRLILSACVIALLIWLPNIYWNWTHQMSSFRHLAEISQVAQSRFHFSELLAFLGAQVGVLGLGSSFLLVRDCLWTYRQEKTDEKTHFCVCFFMVFFAVICVQAFVSRAFANWAAPCYVTAVIWLSHRLWQSGQIRALNMALIVNLLTMVLIYHHMTLYALFSIELNEKSDPMRAVRGWDHLGAEVATVLAQYPDRYLLVDNRKHYTELVYYVSPHPFTAQLFNPERQLKNHFHLIQDLNQLRGQSFLWVTQHSLKDYRHHYFQHVRLLKSIDVPIYPGKSKHYNVFLADRFKGYD